MNDRLDHLTRDVLAARAAGMSYGIWKALHPNTSYGEAEPPAAAEKLPPKQPEGSYHACRHCGRIFWADFSGRRYCTDVCRRKEELRRYQERQQAKRAKRQHKACVICGTPLTGKQTLYCSDLCNQKAYEQRRTGEGR